MRKLGIILMIPLILLVLGSLGAGIYAAYKNIQGITYITPIIIGIMIVLYVIGLYLVHKKCKEKNGKTIN